MRQSVARLGFYGRSEAELKQLDSAYALDQIPKFIRQDALDKILWHKNNGDESGIALSTPLITRFFPTLTCSAPTKINVKLHSDPRLSKI
jgi:hypothetical protein